MSVYSGFTTRQQEDSYQQTLYNMVYLLQIRVLRFFQKEPFDDKRFCKFFMKLFKKLYEYDKIKYLPPRFDTAFRDLAAYFIQNKQEVLEIGTIQSFSSNLSISPFLKTIQQSSGLRKGSEQTRSKTQFDLQNQQSPFHTIAEDSEFHVKSEYDEVIQFSKTSLSNNLPSIRYAGVQQKNKTPSNNQSRNLIQKSLILTDRGSLMAKTYQKRQDSMLYQSVHIQKKQLNQQKELQNTNEFKNQNHRQNLNQSMQSEQSRKSQLFGQRQVKNNVKSDVNNSIIMIQGSERQAQSKLETQQFKQEIKDKDVLNDKQENCPNSAKKQNLNEKIDDTEIIPLTTSKTQLILVQLRIPSRQIFNPQLYTIRS
eukprot:403375680